MLQLRIGIDLASLRLPFKKALHTAARLGADAVEIDARSQLKPRDFTGTALRHLRKMLDDLNLRVCAVSFRTRRGYGDADDIDRRVEATKDALRLAYDLGGPIVVNQVGRVPDEPEGPAWDLLIQVLTDLGSFSQRAGATLAAETGSEDGESLARLVDALPEGAMEVCLNPGNLIVNGFSAQDAAIKLAPYVSLVHANDGVRDLAQGRGIEVPLGRGSVDFPQILGALEEQQFRGYLTIQRSHAEDPVFEIGQAVQYLRSL